MAGNKLTIRQVALFGMLGALTFGAKVAMAPLPNIEPVSLMVMLTAVVFGLKGLYPAGEGAGYAGGIMSAAIDGILCAEALLENL